MSNIKMDKLLYLISIKYSISLDELNELLNRVERDESISGSNKETSKIILPFCGNIIKDNCKALVYNHGLYTQCTKTAKLYCKSCNKDLKYGTIDDRLKFEIGKFVCKNGKRETSYSDFIKKQGYKKSDVVKLLQELNIDISLLNIEKVKQETRGRPKKQVKVENKQCEDTIDVEEIIINDILYFKTDENIVLDKDYNVVGLLNGNNIEKI